MKTKMNVKMKRFFALFLALAMVFSGITITPQTVYAVTNADSSAAASYGLHDDVQDGVILHCWDWSFNNIKAQMATIAASGYSAIQTSPIQEAKEATKGVSNDNWWVLYQPKSFYIDNSGNSALGTKAEFEAMCDEAHKYGIKVIVDVVANHLGNKTGYNVSDAVASDIKDDPSCWHDLWNVEINYGDRYSITHGSMGGLPDLNTESSKIQNYVLNFLKECIDSGADGFRFDAAKHISVSAEGSQYTFWENTLEKAKTYAKSSRGIDLYAYGEILDGTGGPAITSYTKYMSITDNDAGNNVRKAVDSGNASGAASSYYNKGASADKTVLWAESHDTYSNDKFESTYVSTQNINKTWALVASRANATALYFARTAGYRAGTIGNIGTYDWKSAEVVAVNKFHNYFHGQTEYLASSGSIAYNERGTSGVILVNCSGTSTSVSVKANKMKDGTYTDQITGNTFTVSGGTISGQIGSTGIAVVYNAVTEPKATISQQGGNFKAETLSLTLGLSNATSGTYKIGSGSATTYTGSKTITIGSDMSYGESVTVTLTATDGSKTTTDTYTFTKVDPSVVTGNVAYLSLPSGWSTPVYCYAYDEDTAVENAEWPGVQMTLDSASGYYKYELPDTIENARVIFYSSASNRYPADMEDGLECNGSYLYKDGSWNTYTPPVTTGTVIVKYVDENNTSIATSKTLTGKVGATYTTSAATIDGYTLSETPDNASGTYTASTITVTYTYKENVGTEPKVTSSIATGSSFKTETQTIKLTLSNAVSGTYSVDGGPTKTFTSTANVVLGKGKIADSTVTVKATATSSDGTTKEFTFTYEKLFNGTVNEVVTTTSASLLATKTTAVASQGLASQYSINASGVGANKTITVDGDVSDWDSSMLIAQGAANDDPRVYRPNSMYEIPYDAYAMYAAWDNTNLYLMLEMTNVQDVVAPNDNYPLSSNATVDNIPMFIYIDTGKSDAIGNNGMTQAGGYLWNCGTTVSNSFNRVIALSSGVGKNGPYIYGGDSTGINEVELGNATTSGIVYKTGKGIVNSKVMGINGGYGEYNNRTLGDMCSDSSSWVDFNTLGHNSSTMDYNYEISIPLSQLGITKSDIESNGIGVFYMHSSGASGMDCLPYDVTMNDNADQSDPVSNPENSLEKSDKDSVTTSFARVGKSGGGIVPPPSDALELNFGADKSAPQLAGTALTLGGIAQGGTAPYTYKFYVDGTLVATKSGSGKTSVAWTPSAAGEHIIKCVVTDSAGESVTSAKYYTVEKANGDVTALSAKITSSATSVTVGKTVKFTASAAGGTSPYKYRFFIYDTTDGWTALNSSSTTKTYTWTASSAGTHKFLVRVYDSAGAAINSSTVTVKVTAVSTLSGLNKASDGNWYYYTNGVIDTSYTGLAKNAYGHWYVKAGKLDLTYNGMAKNSYGWWYVKNGKLDLTYTGLAANKYGTWYMNKGKLDTSVTGLTKCGTIWVYLTKGKLDTSVSGMVYSNSGWIYLSNGKQDTTYTGLAYYKKVWWYINKGKLDLTYTGLADNKYGTWYVTKGKLDTTVTGMIYSDSSWVYVSKGKLDTTYTGLAKNKYGWWYMSNGKLDRTYTGLVKYGNVTWYVKEGKLDKTCTGMVQTADGWWYINGGKVDTSYTGMMKYKTLWLYVKDGKFDMSYTGLVKYSSTWVYVDGGILDTSYTGIAKNAYGWWYVTNGKLDLTYTGTTKYKGVTFKVVKGQVIL